MRASKVLKCCCASTVVGQRSATCLPGHGGAERGAQRDLGLAEAHVAADEPVHRAGGLEVAVDVVDGARLVGGLVEGKARLERAVVVVGGRERVPREGRALGVEAQELVGHLAHLARDARLGAGERAAPELVELRRRALAAHVLAELVEPPDRQIQLVAASVLDGDEVDGVASGDRLVDEPLVAADPVLGVHDVVAEREAPQVFEEGARRVGGLRALAAPVGARAEDLLLGDQHEPVGREHDAARERTDDDLDLAATARRATTGRTRPGGAGSRCPGAAGASRFARPASARAP